MEDVPYPLSENYPHIYLPDNEGFFVPGFGIEPYFNRNMSLQDMISLDIQAELNDLANDQGLVGNNYGGYDLVGPATTATTTGVVDYGPRFGYGHVEEASDAGAFMVNPVSMMPVQPMAPPPPQQQHPGYQSTFYNPNFGQQHQLQQQQQQLTVRRDAPTAGSRPPQVRPATADGKSVNNPTANKKRPAIVTPNEFPKPAFSYSCLIVLALKNSPTGALSVAEIYRFMCEHFPYFRTAPPGWKNSVRHNLSLNKGFLKIEKSETNHGSGTKKGYLWALNPDKSAKMYDEITKWLKKDPKGIKLGMARPETLESLERGEMGMSYTDHVDSDDDGDPRTPSSSVSSFGSHSVDSADTESFATFQEFIMPTASNQIYQELKPDLSTMYLDNSAFSSNILSGGDAILTEAF